MTIQDLINQLLDLTNSRIPMETPIIVEEFILGFQEDIEDVIITNDKFTGDQLVAIIFRNQ